MFEMGLWSRSISMFLD